MQDPTFTSETRGSRGTSETSRNFTFTLNNYTDEELTRIENYPDWIRYIKYGKEVADTGTPHLQGFAITWDPVRKTKFKLFLRKAHIEVMKGSIEHNDNYCEKEGNWVEFGERPQQGRRNDILGVKRRLDQGVPLSELYENESFFTTIMRNEKSLSKYAEMQRCKKMRSEGRMMPKVYIRVGPTRSGKTSYVYEQHGFSNVYSVPDVTGKWHDGYRGEPVLLYDDVDHSRAPEIEYFKKITDGYPFQAPYKGGFCYIRPTHIYITSNELPSEWWPGITQPHWNAIKNRITEVRKVYKNKPDEVVYPVQDASDEAQEEQGSQESNAEGSQTVLQEEENGHQTDGEAGSE